jgi:hypothetical protein
MSQPVVSKSRPTSSPAYALLESQEPLPPYELDPAFESMAVRKRIGEVIAKAVGRRSSKRNGARQSRRQK